MNSYYIWTVGCQMNKADSERLESAMEQMGLSPTPSPKEADVVVLNSCVVRQSAEDRVVGMVTSLKPVKERRPDKIVALMGCMVGPRSTELERRFPTWTSSCGRSSSSPSSTWWASAWASTRRGVSGR